jgi:predicted dehydrogenase
LCGADLAHAQDLYEAARTKGVRVFVGYDHVVGEAARAAVAAARNIGTVTTLDVEFREFWGGIFAAHPWLEGPWDTYLGFWQRGGGASGEHSHGANLWQHFAHAVGAGRVVEVSATLDYVRDGRVDYDQLCLLNLRTETGMVGRVVQDVVTAPPRKWARIQGGEGFVEWHCGFEPGCDAVIEKQGASDPGLTEFTKSRPDDFIQELRHIQANLEGPAAAPDISIERGLDTMLVVAAAHLSAAEGRVVRIDYAAGYTNSALSTK